MRIAAMLLVLAAAVILPVTVRAADPSDALVTEVLERNPSLRARALRRDALGREARAEGLYPDPEAFVMVDRVPEERGGEMPMVRYQIVQMFPWPGKLGLMRSAVERQRDAADAELELRKLDLRLEARRAYAMLLLNSKRREINRANRNLAQTIAQATLGRYASGTGGHHDVVRAQVEVNALDTDLVSLEGERVSMIAMINALRDRAVDAAVPEAPYVPSPREPLPPLAQANERAEAQRTELRGMKAMESEALAMADLARRERYPDLMGSLWMNQNIGIPPSAGAMVGARIPVFGISRQNHRAAAFDARAQGVAQDAGAMRAMIRFEVASALARVNTATRRLELVETVVLPKARESFETSLAAYGAGTVDLVGLLDARRSLQAASLALVEAQIDREIALAELERALGTPIAGGPR